MKHYLFGVAAIIVSAPVFCISLHAQAITGYSHMGEEGTCPPGTSPVNKYGAPTCGAYNWLNPYAAGYSSTEEDYIASLYYQVSSGTDLYYGDTVVAGRYSLPASNSSAYPINYFYPDLVSDGLYSEVTYHEVTFYYIASTGSYYDPYGYSGAGSGFSNGSSDGVTEADIGFKLMFMELTLQWRW